MTLKHTGMLFILSAMLGLAGTSLAQDKFAFIDLDRSFNEYYKTKMAKSRLEEQAEEYNQERTKLVEEGKAMEEKFNQIREEAQNSALSEEVRDDKRNAAEELLVELRDFENKLRRFDTSRKKQLDDQSRRMRKHLVEEIQGSIIEYARNHSYKVVLDSSGDSLNGVPIVLFVDEKIDITDAVLEIINKEN